MSVWEIFGKKSPKDKNLADIFRKLQHFMLSVPSGAFHKMMYPSPRSPPSLPSHPLVSDFISAETKMSLRYRTNWEREMISIRGKLRERENNYFYRSFWETTVLAGIGVDIIAKPANVIFSKGFVLPQTNPFLSLARMVQRHLNISETSFIFIYLTDDVGLHSYTTGKCSVS